MIPSLLQSNVIYYRESIHFIDIWYSTPNVAALIPHKILQEDILPPIEKDQLYID